MPTSITTSSPPTPARSTGSSATRSSRGSSAAVAARREPVAVEDRADRGGVHGRLAAAGRACSAARSRRLLVLAAREQSRTRGGDHRGVVGAQRGGRKDRVKPARSPRGELAAQAPVRRHTADDGDAPPCAAGQRRD